MIVKPSRITTHSNTLIDNIFTNNLSDSSHSGLLINDITDHLPVFTFTDQPLQHNHKEKHYSYIRTLNENSINLFRTALDNQNWENVYSEDDVDIAYDKCMEVFTTLYNQCCPIKKIFVKNK